MRTVTCCKPVPEAATTPIGPLRTLLAKPKPIPLTIAVPQSGPITNNPFWAACCFSEISSSSETLSLYKKTCLLKLYESAEYLAKREEVRLAEIELMRARERVVGLRPRMPKGAQTQE